MSSLESQSIASSKSLSGSGAHKRQKDDIRRAFGGTVFSLRQLKALGIGSLIIVMAISAFLIAKPTYLEFDVARTSVCVLISLYLSIFFYLFWPQEIEIKYIPIINLPIRVAGPIVLWFVVLALLLKILTPQGSNWVFYTPIHDGPVFYLSDTAITKNDGGDLEYHLVQKTARGETDKLEGILIRFGPGEDSINAVFRMEYFEPLQIRFDRTKSKVDLSALKRVNQ